MYLVYNKVNFTVDTILSIYQNHKHFCQYCTFNKFE